MSPKSQKKEYELFYEGKEPEDSILSHLDAPCLKKIKTFRSNVNNGSVNILVHGDNLSALRALLKAKLSGGIKNADGSVGVRVVYIDPPFSTGKDFKDAFNQKAYADRMIGKGFIEFLRKRLILLRELLSERGSIFVHLDWKKAHYVKVVMDEVFGEENFLNDIVWSYGGRGAKAISGQFSRNHDIILWYQKDSHVFNRIYVEKRVSKGAGFKRDARGRWFKTSPRGDYTDESVRGLSREGRIYKTKNGNIRIKYFLKEDGGCLIEDKPVGDVWDDIPDAMHLSSSEKTGYPTQKPELLLCRIIKASSNPGDIVLDAFAGAGTTLAVSEKLGRRWIGIDSGTLSIDTIRKRLLKIGESKDPEDPGKKYLKPCGPFALYKTGNKGT